MPKFCSALGVGVVNPLLSFSCAYHTHKCIILAPCRTICLHTYIAYSCTNLLGCGTLFSLRASPQGSPRGFFFLTLRAPAVKKVSTHAPGIAFFAGFVQF
uniref:Uncharacterized protein n=1 Tax=Aegilops tauschii subsp. strangulata TaxID=200361 RepID=A0A452YK04_AEGTS